MSQRLPFIKGELIRESVLAKDDSDEDEEAGKMPSQVSVFKCYFQSSQSKCAPKEKGCSFVKYM